MEAETRRRVEEAVIDILKKAPMEELTEFKVRVTASERLGMDLTGIEQKSFVRSVIESFLLSMEETAQGTETESNVQEETREVADEERVTTKQTGETNGVADRVICKLSNKRSVVIHDVNGRTYVSIREYYRKDGKQIPSGRGISLTAEQWSAFKKCVPATQEAIMKMESKLRSELQMQTEDQPTSMTACTPQLIPINIDRFDGKNYHCWEQQMELFLNQQKIAYVLNEPCPSLTPSPETSIEERAQAKAAERKWRNDDYICVRHILNSLSDHLFHQYSKRNMSAKELWEELRFVYLYEEHGTKRSLVKKYTEFQMVDGKPILEQVQEVNNIADSIIAAGISIDENFHVSAIISKLPPSWKDFHIKLMREEYLPFWVLMDRLMVEEELRRQNNQGQPSNPINFQTANKPGPRPGDMKKPNMSWKRESKSDSKAIVCYACGKKGHTSKHCQSRKLDKDLQLQEKRGQDNTSTSAVAAVLRDFQSSQMTF